VLALPVGKGAEMSERSITEKTAKGGRRFDPVLFFDTAAKGRTISKHGKSEIIFSQGDEANAVFYIKKGKVKVTIVSKQGKEAVVAILVSTNSWVKGA
jgi:CRP/FNR family cyclic AMP-dependent transcriptional regulator